MTPRLPRSSCSAPGRQLGNEAVSEEELAALSVMRDDQLPRPDTELRSLKRVSGGWPGNGHASYPPHNALPRMETVPGAAINHSVGRWRTNGQLIWCAVGLSRKSVASS